MTNAKILSVLLISTLAACTSGAEKVELTQRTPEERCLELESRWDAANQELVKAEARLDGSWLYHVADNFNPLSSSRNDSLETKKLQEQRTRENYIAFGCMEMNKMKIQSTYNTQPAQQFQQELAPEAYIQAPVAAEPNIYGSLLVNPNLAPAPAFVAQQESMLVSPNFAPEPVSSQTLGHSFDSNPYINQQSSSVISQQNEQFARQESWLLGYATN